MASYSTCMTCHFRLRLLIAAQASLDPLWRHSQSSGAPRGASRQGDATVCYGRNNAIKDYEGTL